MKKFKKWNSVLILLIICLTLIIGCGGGGGVGGKSVYNTSSSQESNLKEILLSCMVMLSGRRDLSHITPYGQQELKTTLLLSGAFMRIQMRMGEYSILSSIPI